MEICRLSSAQWAILCLWYLKLSLLKLQMHEQVSDAAPLIIFSPDGHACLSRHRKAEATGHQPNDDPNNRNPIYTAMMTIDGQSTGDVLMLMPM